MIRRPPRSTQSRSSAASDVYKRQIAGVDAQRVDVLHGADRDARVLVVAHHLVLDLLPADETLLHHHLADGAGTQAGPHALAVISLHLDDPAAGPAKREGGPDDRRQPDLRQRAIGRGGTLGVRGSLDDRRRRIGLFQAVQQVAELLAILGTPWRSRTPACARAIARLSAVWPPRPARRPSGFSRAITASIAATVSGSR